MTDIKMPDMDGLELISEIRKKNKDAQIIILSNYRDFDYARQAIRFGVSQYLIKSEINEKNLMDTLKSLTFVHESKPDTSSDLTEKQQKYIQKQIVNMQNCTPSLKMFALPAAGLFSQQEYYLMCCSCDVSQLESDTVNMLEKMLNSLIVSRFHGAVYSTEVLRQKLISGVVLPVQQLNGKGADYLMEQGKLLIRNVKQYNDVDLTIGISLPGDCARFPAMFTEAELARQNCFFTSQDISLYNTKFSQKKDKPPKVGLAAIKALIDSTNWQGLKDYIADIFAKLRDLEKYEYLQSCYIDFLFIAKSLCEEYHVNDFSSDKFDYESLSVIPTIELVEDHVCNLYCELFNVIQNVSGGHSYYVKACLAFITNNYHTSITLNDAAKTTNISSSYLSLIFKQEMGINFSDYLTQYRIEQAKRLLTTTNLHVYEIAQKVGFSSPYYFSRVFKDVTKMTCKDYKDRFTKV